MKLFDSFDAVPASLGSSVITIGVFDGIHVGHQMLIKSLHYKGKEAAKGMITFDKRPAAYFRPQEAGLPFMTLTHRLHLLSQYGLDFVLCLPFNHEIADMSYEDFLAKAQEKLHFSSLVLGAGASLGKARAGNETTLPALGKKQGFEVEFLQKAHVQKQIVSSTYLRQLVAAGELKKLKKCLGRRYSLFIPDFKAEAIEQKGKWLTFQYTFENLTSLPSGTYTLSLVSPSGDFSGFAMLTDQTKLSPARFVLDVFFAQPHLASGPLTLVFMDQINPKSQLQMQSLAEALPSSNFILQTSKNLNLEEHE